MIESKGKANEVLRTFGSVKVPSGKRLLLPLRQVCVLETPNVLPAAA